MAEAQRLISVSLGKIAQSRGQRGGASLYKNLLVSTVLHKARHAFMVENFSAMLQAKKAQKEAKEAEEEALEQPPRPLTPAPSILSVPTPPTTQKTEHKIEDKENKPPVQNLEHSDTKENNTLSENKQDSNCAKCLKRRMTDVQAPQSAALTETSPNKRAKHDTSDSNNNNNTNKCDISSSQEDEVPSCHEPMQTEQISSLVNRFNSGLSGLLSSSSSGHVDASQTDSYGSSSCSTQVSTFSESLGSRPVIALTV